MTTNSIATQILIWLSVPFLVSRATTLADKGVSTFSVTLNLICPSKETGKGGVMSIVEAPTHKSEAVTGFEVTKKIINGKQNLNRHLLILFIIRVYFIGIIPDKFPEVKQPYHR